MRTKRQTLANGVDACGGTAARRGGERAGRWGWPAAGLSLAVLAAAWVFAAGFGGRATGAPSDAPASPAVVSPGAAKPWVAGAAQIRLNGKPAPEASLDSTGFRLIAPAGGPQVAVFEPAGLYLADLAAGEEAAIDIPVPACEKADAVCGRFWAAGPAGQPAAANVEMRVGAGQAVSAAVDAKGATVSARLAEPKALAAGGTLSVRLTAPSGGATVYWQDLAVRRGPEEPPAGGLPFAMAVKAWPENQFPAPVLADPRPGVERAMIEWDWRLQDGIGAARQPATYAAAVEQALRRGDLLIAGLRQAGAAPAEAVLAQWEALRQRAKEQQARAAAPPAQAGPTGAQVPGPLHDVHWVELWREVHWLKRGLMLSHPLLARMGAVVFIKQVPGTFSHQLTQVYGRYARPGGGVFVLEQPGRSMACRSLTAGRLGEGSCQHADVSFDGRRVLFAFCEAATTPGDSLRGQKGRFYHLYEAAADGSGLRPLTSGEYDDFSPRYLSDGKILFVSTRRGGWHRCGNPGCENYTLALAEADGSRPRPISWHETQEWDPALLNDGRIVYTRWDYVDRHAVYYEQLWTVRPDGSNPAAFYGNNTFNPVGVWEPRAVPGSTRVMATAAAHHASTAGSIVLIDTARGVDGLGPIARLTPDALFPESETTVLPHWRGEAGCEPIATPVEQLRWPGHCYRSPWPLSETLFLAAYSFQPLVGEPKACSPNMFGLYAVDAAGNKELLYRDANLCSLWPMALKERPRPPVYATGPAMAMGGGGEARAAVGAATQPAGAAGTAPARAKGIFFLQNVYASAPALPAGEIKALRIVQVVPKSTPGANNPPVGLPNASPGKQVLGTVPVEADGSACFEAPANLPLAFQALDERGQAVQVMRTTVYLQEGETLGCVGCHEHRTAAPPRRGAAGMPPLAGRRPPSVIHPGPDGSAPLSYPLLVQPVLDKHCVRCHAGEKPKAGIDLTGRPAGHYTASYAALAKRVPFSCWGVGNFRAANSEPLAAPNFFGARGSRLMKMLLAGHNKVALSADDLDRLITWMDANALFYGTFDPADQARQKAGQRIEGPKLQ